MSTMSFANQTASNRTATKSLLILPAAGITLALFYGMAALISSDPLISKAPLPAIDISLVTPPPPSKLCKRNQNCSRRQSRQFRLFAPTWLSRG